MYKIYNLNKNINGEIMIKKIMSSKIISGNIDNSVKDISNLMKENNIGFMPIKEKDDFIGVITDRDICLAIPTLKNLNDSVKSYITNNIISIDINSSIDDALNLMGKYKIKRLLVKEKDNIVGILSLSDILNYTNNTNIINTFKTIFYIHDNKSSMIAEIDSFYL